MPPSLNLAGIPRASQDVVTTTIFANNGAPTTSASSSSSSGTSIPIGAIVGGLLGGVFLALAAVGGWIWWGKIIEKQNRKEPRLRSALKKVGQSTPGMASRRSLPRSHPMASVSHKSVSFAPVPSPRSSEDSDSPQTPSPGASFDVSSTEDKDKSRQTSRTTLLNEPGIPASPSASRPRTSSASRGAIRPPASLRSQSSERGYAPARPSPLAQATHPLSSPPPSSSPPSPSSTRAPRTIVHPVVDARSKPVQELLSPRQPSTAYADRSSGVSVPSEYSQEGTASEGELPLRTLRPPDGRLYSRTERDKPFSSGSGMRVHPS